MAVNASSYPRRLAPSPHRRIAAPTTTSATRRPLAVRARTRTGVVSDRVAVAIPTTRLSSRGRETDVSPR